MRQGPKPAKSEEAKPPVGRKSPKDDSGKVREVEERLEEALRGKAEAQEQLRTRDRELVEAQGQQTATGEVLRIISGSPTDLQPVFDAIAASALRLCGGVHSGVWLYDGELIHLAALENVTPKGGESIRRDYPRPADMSSGTGRTVLTRAVVQIADVLQDPAYGLMGEARAVGFRSFLSAPMLQSGKLVGIVGVSRSEAGPFPDKLVQLLQTFADQAVIAIENVRLFTELQEKNRALTQAHAQVTESLEQQTATADILQVISRSPTDVQPVFDTIVTSARALTGAQACGVFLLHSDIVSIAAHDSLSDEWRQEYPRVVSANTVTGRAMLERTTVHVKDLETNPDYEGAPGRRVGIRTVLAVPMLREGQTIGAIAVWRTEVKSFSDKQIALLQTFVDQAIIAIENVRLFKELEARNRELTTTLDRQTTTADVLRIIAQSQTDLQPVLDAIAASAVRLCAASDAVIERLEGDRFYNAAHAGTQMTGLVGLPLPLTRRFPGGRAVLDRTPIIIDDIQLVAESEYPDTLELLRLNTIHSVAEIPLLSEGKPLGSLAVLRAEMRPFTDAEVALLQTFADQAVIAIENVRLFTELQQKNEALTQANAQVTEALDQQTATSEILRVIASSPTDVQPVFDTIAERAMRLCGADQGWVFSFDGELIHVKSLANVSEEGTDAVRQAYPVAPSRGMVTGRAILTGDVVHIPDVRDDPEYSLKAVAETASYRGLLGVPMLHRGRPIGVISVPRTGPGPFSERQIEVLKTFADQAVIAIENVRLFTELQTSNRELTTALGKV